VLNYNHSSGLLGFITQGQPDLPAGLPRIYSAGSTAGRIMHYYQFNIGDYKSHTSGLSLIEDIAYRRLLDLYYLNERPFNGCSTDVAREIGMREHQEEVEYVLNKFFPSDGNGSWINKRAEEEVRAYRMKKKTAAAAGRASGKARRSKSSERAFDSVEPTINQEPITSNQLKDNVPTVRVKTPRSSPVPAQEIVNNWNDFAEINRLPKVVKITNTLRAQIRQRWNDIPSLEQWDNFFDEIGSSRFLSGKAPAGNGRTQPFRATLLWVTKETNFAKIAAGEYN